MIFREYDIRGLVEKDLKQEVVENIGKAVGTKFKKLVVVGRDNRPSSKKFRDWLVKGINSTGCNVIDIGLVTTPMLYFSTATYKEADGGVMITGSHLPKEYNGFKICKGHGMTIHGKEIQQLKKRIIEKGFKKGIGKVETRNQKNSYLKDLRKKIKKLPKKLKVVIDAGNGTAGIVAPQFLKSIGCEVKELYCKLDGNFPNHLADPTVVEYMQDLVREVKKTKADLGIGFDGDCDRIGVVDEKGNMIWGDKLLIIYSRQILKKKRGAKIIFEVKCSQTLPNDIKKHGGIPIMWKTGHSLLKDKMYKENAELAGEMSGHICFKEHYGFDDALFAAGKLLEAIAKTNKSMSEMLMDVPKTYTTPEIRLPCPDEKKFKIAEQAKNHFKKEKKYKVIDIDGVRVQFKDGWGLVRASNTEPVIVLRVEAKTKKRLKEIRKVMEKQIIC